MKIAVIILVAVACGVTAYYFGIELPKTQTFAMQEKCTKRAKEFFMEKYSGAQAGEFYDYSCHFNKRSNKCFIEISANFNQPNYVSNNYFLFDAYEGRQYAYFHKLVNMNAEEKRNWNDIPPGDCYVNEKKCNSIEEFKSLTQQYLNE